MPPTSARPRKDREAAPRALDLDAFFPYRLSVLQRAVSRVIAQVYAREFGLSVHEWRALAVLGSEQPLSANEICARTTMDKVQVSRAIDRLLKKGLAARRAHARDRRRAELRLSAKGEGIYRAIVPRALARERDLLAVFSRADLARLDALLGRLDARAKAMLKD